MKKVTETNRVGKDPESPRQFPEKGTDSGG